MTRTFIWFHDEKNNLIAQGPNFDSKEEANEWLDKNCKNGIVRAYDKFTAKEASTNLPIAEGVLLHVFLK